MLPRDWTLLVVATAKAPVQPVQLQKSIFLLSRNLTSAQLQCADFYKFEPYDYGPFCSEVYSDAKRLEVEGLLLIRVPASPRFNHYEATEQGVLRARELKAHLDGETAAYLDTAVQFTQALSFTQLVTSIYKAYPDMKINSVFRG